MPPWLRPLRYLTFAMVFESQVVAVLRGAQQGCD